MGENTAFDVYCKMSEFAFDPGPTVKIAAKGYFLIIIKYCTAEGIQLY